MKEHPVLDGVIVIVLILSAVIAGACLTIGIEQRSNQSEKTIQSDEDDSSGLGINPINGNLTIEISPGIGIDTNGDIGPSIGF